MRNSGVTASGVYSIDPDGKDSMNVSCDMTTDGGGWDGHAEESLTALRTFTWTGPATSRGLVH